MSGKKEKQTEGKVCPPHHPGRDSEECEAYCGSHFELIFNTVANCVNKSPNTSILLCQCNISLTPRSMEYPN